MNKHAYTIEVIGEMLDKFERQANAVKRAITTKTEDHTLTEKESYLILSILEAFIGDQDETISKVLAKEIMYANEHRKQSDTIN